MFRQDDDLLLVHTNAQLVDSEGHPMGLSLFAALGVSQSTVKKEHEGNGFALLMRRNIVTGATVLFRRSLLTFVLPFPKHWVHDEWLAVMAAALGKIDVSEDQLVKYRQHSNNQIGATALTLKGRWSRLTRDREDRNRLLLRRAEDLFARLEKLSNHVSPANIQLAHHKVEHEKRRNSLPARRWARILPVMLEAATGRYRTMGSGANDILRDLVQPSLTSKQVEKASS
ncbi:MAG: hypothetical protein JJE28_05910 [Actinomycetales bacterium]|nr:hypothetical protein [Actinomycetales bacterium]